MTDSKEIVKVAPEYAIISRDPAELAEVFAENLGNGAIGPTDLQRVKIPAGGGRHWTIPSLDGDKAVTELTGIIVHQQDIRTYWEAGIGEGESGTPPDCSSNDAIHGVGNPGGSCAVCPLAQFGSAGGGSKRQACHLKRLIFMVQPDEILPIALTLPAMSIPNAKKYFLGLASKGVAYHGVVTSWSLDPTKNAGGIAYSQAVPKAVKFLSKEEHAAVRAYAKTIKATLDKISLTNMDKTD